MAGGRVRRVDVPESLRARPEFARADYTSAFTLDGGAAPTPEQWARRCFEGAPALLRLLLVVGWTVVLRLRLGRRSSPDTVLGWYITESSEASVTLSAGSALLESQNVFVQDGSSITWVTVVRTHTRAGRTLWRLIAPTHELSVPLLMRRAAADRRR